jgi:hypothetical protein
MYSLIPPSLRLPPHSFCSSFMQHVRLKVFTAFLLKIQFCDVVGTVVSKILKHHRSFLPLHDQAVRSYSPNDTVLSQKTCFLCSTFILSILYNEYFHLCFRYLMWDATEIINQTSDWHQHAHQWHATLCFLISACIQFLREHVCFVVGAETFVNGCCNAAHHRTDRPHFAWKKECKSYSHVGRKW